MCGRPLQVQNPVRTIRVSGTTSYLSISFIYFVTIPSTASMVFNKIATEESIRFEKKCVITSLDLYIEIVIF